jgi:hypothetical protein
MNRSAPSIKEEFREIAVHILRNYELMPKELVHEHRLKKAEYSTLGSFCLF